MTQDFHKSSGQPNKVGASWLEVGLAFPSLTATLPRTLPCDTTGFARLQGSDLACGSLPSGTGACEGEIVPYSGIIRQMSVGAKVLPDPLVEAALAGELPGWVLASSK